MVFVPFCHFYKYKEEIFMAEQRTKLANESNRTLFNTLEVTKFLLAQYLLEIEGKIYEYRNKNNLQDKHSLLDVYSKIKAELEKAYQEIDTQINDVANQQNEININGYNPNNVPPLALPFSYLLNKINGNNTLKMCAAFRKNLSAHMNYIIQNNVDSQDPNLFSTIFKDEIDVFTRMHNDILLKKTLSPNGDGNEPETSDKGKAINHWAKALSYSKSTSNHESFNIFNVKPHQLINLQNSPQYKFVIEFLKQRQINLTQHIANDNKMISIIKQLIDRGIYPQTFETDNLNVNNMYFPCLPYKNDNITYISHRSTYDENQAVINEYNLVHSLQDIDLVLLNFSKTKILCGNNLALLFMKASQENKAWLDSDFHKFLLNERPTLYLNLSALFYTYSGGFSLLSSYYNASGTNELMSKVVEHLRRFNDDKKSVKYFYVLLKILDAVKDTLNSNIDAIDAFLNSRFLDLLAMQIDNIQDENDPTLNYLFDVNFASAIASGIATTHVAINDNKDYGYINNQYERLYNAIKENQQSLKSIFPKLYFCKSKYRDFFDFIFSFTDDNPFYNALKFLNDLCDKDFLSPFMENFNSIDKDTLRDIIKNYTHKDYPNIETSLIKLYDKTNNIFFIPKSEFNDQQKQKINELISDPNKAKELFARTSIVLNKIKNKIVGSSQLDDNIKQNFLQQFKQLQFELNMKFINWNNLIRENAPEYKLQYFLETIIDQTGCINIQSLMTRIPKTLRSNLENIIKENGYHTLFNSEITQQDKTDIPKYEIENSKTINFLIKDAGSILAGVSQEQLIEINEIENKINDIRSNQSNITPEYFNRINEIANQAEQTIQSSNRNSQISNDLLGNTKILNQQEKMFNGIPDEIISHVKDFFAAAMTDIAFEDINKRPQGLIKNYFDQHIDKFVLNEQEQTAVKKYNESKKVFENEYNFYATISTILTAFTQNKSFKLDLAFMYFNSLQEICNIAPVNDINKQYILGTFLNFVSKIMDSSNDNLDINACMESIRNLLTEINETNECLTNILKEYDTYPKSESFEASLSKFNEINNKMQVAIENNAQEVNSIWNTDIQNQTNIQTQLLESVDNKHNLYKFFIGFFEQLDSYITVSNDNYNWQMADAFITTIDTKCKLAFQYLTNPFDPNEQLVLKTFKEVIEDIKNNYKSGPESYDSNIEMINAIKERFSSQWQSIKSHASHLQTLKNLIQKENKDDNDWTQIKNLYSKEITPAKLENQNLTDLINENSSEMNFISIYNDLKKQNFDQATFESYIFQATLLGDTVLIAKLNSLKTTYEYLNTLANDLDIIKCNDTDLKSYNTFLFNHLFMQNVQSKILNLKYNAAADILAQEGQKMCMEKSNDIKTTIINDISIPSLDENGQTKKIQISGSLKSILTKNKHIFTTNELQSIRRLLDYTSDQKHLKQILVNLGIKNLTEDFTDNRNRFLMILIKDINLLIKLKQTYNQYTQVFDKSYSAPTVKLLIQRYISNDTTENLLSQYSQSENNNIDALRYLLMDSNKTRYEFLQNENYVPLVNEITTYLPSLKNIGDDIFNKIVKEILDQCLQLSNNDNKNKYLKAAFELMQNHCEIFIKNPSKIVQLCKLLKCDLTDLTFSRIEKILSTKNNSLINGLLNNPEDVLSLYTKILQPQPTQNKLELFNRCLNNLSGIWSQPEIIKKITSLDEEQLIVLLKTAQKGNVLDLINFDDQIHDKSVRQYQFLTNRANKNNDNTTFYHIVAQAYVNTFGSATDSNDKIKELIECADFLNDHSQLLGNEIKMVTVQNFLRLRNKLEKDIKKFDPSNSANEFIGENTDLIKMIIDDNKLLNQILKLKITDQKEFNAAFSESYIALLCLKHNIMRLESKPDKENELADAKSKFFCITHLMSILPTHENPNKNTWLYLINNTSAYARFLISIDINDVNSLNDKINFLRELDENSLLKKSFFNYIDSQEKLTCNNATKLFEAYQKILHPEKQIKSETNLCNEISTILQPNNDSNNKCDQLTNLISQLANLQQVNASKNETNEKLSQMCSPLKMAHGTNKISQSTKIRAN